MYKTSRMRQLLLIVSLLFVFGTTIIGVRIQVNASENSTSENSRTASTCSEGIDYIDYCNSNVESKSMHEIISVFLSGFFSAALGVVFGAMLTTINNKKKAKLLQKDLEEELKGMIPELKNRIKDKSNVDLFKYKTPMWDICFRSGIFNQLDSGTYKKYINIYSFVQYAKEIENDWWLITCTGGDVHYKDILHDTRIEIAEAILKSLNEYFGITDGNTPLEDMIHS